jgi:hypothetical protein
MIKNKLKTILIAISIMFVSSINLYSQEKQISNIPEMQDSRFACKSYFNEIAGSKNDRVRGWYTYYIYDDFGFYLQESYEIKKVGDTFEANWKQTKDKDNNFRVGNIYNFDTAYKIHSGDSILLVNNKKIKTMNDWFKIILDKKINEIKIKLLNQNGEAYEAILKKTANDFNAVRHSILDFSITDVDIKKGSYDLSIRHSFVNRFDTTTVNSKDNHPILDIALGTLVYYNHVQKQHMYHICDVPDKIFNEGSMLAPDKGFIINNIIKNDLQLEQRSQRITPYHTLVGNELNYIDSRVIKFNVMKIKNSFNLKSFPFDKQTLKFQLIDNIFFLETRTIQRERFTYNALEKFMSIDDINGWEKKSYTVKNKPFVKTSQMDGTFNDSLIVSVVLERKSSYYIFKVIFPILLILMVCWSAVWINPKEIESRLTITIVCLLSLIAYNFVIDSDLPKLEYLTIMDYIILISYIYAAIPNFLSIYSFQLIKKNKLLAEKYEFYEKRYGLPSYMLIIFLIIIFNVTSSPEHTNSMFAWASMR